MPSRTLSSTLVALVILWCSDVFAADNFRIRRLEPSDSGERHVASLLNDAALLSDFATFVNGTLLLPERLTLEFGGSDGPLYDPAKSQIVVPYEFVDYTQKLFRQGVEKIEQEELDAVSLDVLEHTLYHELGHALVDMLELPIVGKEEDAVDGLATILLIESFEEGSDVVASVADMFYLEDEASGEDVSFWDDHSLDIQRFYNTLCLVYGSDPENNADLVEDIEMDEERLEQCPYDYEQQLQSWLKLLKPHLRDAGGFIR